MELTGEELIPLPQQATWNALNDTAVLKACIPGCESVEQVTPTEFDVAMTAKVGPVSAKFKGKMKLTDVVPPQGYTIMFEGQGGVAGFAKGEARVELAPDAGGTRLGYTAKAMIGGKLAQVGARLIDGVAKRMAAQFFSAFNEHVSGGQGTK